MNDKWQQEASTTLIIEDCVHSSLTMKNILKKNGYQAISCCGDQGIKVAIKERPSIILLGADGYLVKPNHYPWLIKRIKSVLKEFTFE